MSRVHSLVRFFLFGVASSSSLPHGRPRNPVRGIRLRAGASCRGSCPLRDVIGGVHIEDLLHGGPRHGNSQFPLGSVLRFSRPLDGLLRLRRCGLVSSRCRVQGFVRPGVSPVSQHGRLVAGPCPLAVRACALTGGPAATPSRFDFEALFRETKRSPKVGVEPSSGSLPSSALCLLQVPALASDARLPGALHS